MATVHTEYGPGRIIDQETVRGRTRVKVAGEGFEIWLDAAKVGAYESPENYMDQPHWDGHRPSDPVPSGPLLPPGEFEDEPSYPDRGSLRRHPDYLFEDDPDARYASRKTGFDQYDDSGFDPSASGADTGFDAEEAYRAIVNDDPYAESVDDSGDYAGYGEHLDRHTPGARGSYDDDPDNRYAHRRHLAVFGDDDDYGDFDPSHAPSVTADDPESYLDEIMNDDPYAHHHHEHFRDLDSPAGPGLHFDDDPDARFARRQVVPGKAGSPGHLAWAPLDKSNSTELPYNPEPQHHAIGTPGDDGSSTIQPIHHIDADERLTPANSITFEEGDDDGSPEPSRELFAALQKHAIHPGLLLQHPKVQEWVNEHGDEAVRAVLPHAIDMLPLPPAATQGLHNLITKMPPELVEKATGVATDYTKGHWQGQQLGRGINGVDSVINRGLNAIAPGAGWGDLVKDSSVHEATPAALLPMLLRTVGPMVAGDILGGGQDGGVVDGALAATDLGSGYGDLVKDSSYRPAGLSDKYIDITAGADYHNDPVAQFRHDPDAYINRIGHLMDEGLNPRFAEYMDLVEADSSIRTAAWKDVRKKAMRLKREGHVTVKDIGPHRIMASVVGDHGTYDVLILKSGSFGGLHEGNPGHSIANWHCGCEWGKWAFRRKFTYVGRLCSHAYASYLTLQSASMKGKPRQTKRPTKAPKQDRALTFPYIKGSLHTADALQNGPKRLTPELVVNDADDAHTFLDVTKDERKDVGPDDVVSEKDIVHFARLMRHCEVSEQPYPRELVAFLSRYAGCADDSSDDTQADYEAHGATDANEYLEKIRSDADRKQEEDFGNMADRVHKIQDAVEEARAHGVDADRFVANRRTAAPGDPAEQPRPQPQVPQAPPGMVLRQQPSAISGQAVKAPDRGPQAESSPPSVNAYGGTPITERIVPGTAVKAPDEGDDSIQRPNWQPNPGRSEVEYKENGGGFDSTGRGNNGSGGGQKNNSSGGNESTGGGGYTAPGGGQTSGPVSDGGRAGAENGNNAAITSESLQDGYYTVGEGDTLTDIAQRAYGDMNKYQDLAKANSNITNVDALNVGDKIKIDNPTGNNDMTGAQTNPAGGGSDNNISTPETKVDTSAAGGTNANAGADTGAVTTPSNGAADNAATNTATNTNNTKESSAKWWLQKMADNHDGTAAAADPADPQQPTSNGSATTTTTKSTSPGAQPAANPATSTSTSTSGDAKQITPNKETETYDPNDPASQAAQSNSAANPGAQPMSGTPGNQFDMSGIGDALGTGLGIAGDIGSAAMQAAPSIASGVGDAISGLASGIGSIFASKSDFDEFVRYAYPTADGEGDLEPHTHPFAGSGYPGPLEIGTSEEYADKARAKADDVTDLGDGDLTKPMGEWQKQSSVDDDDPYREASIGYSTDDDSDIVRAFQANLADTALGAGGGGGFDDIAGAAQGFLRTAGRNYSLAEQSELIREGDKGGARNLDSLDLTGTHYEDMHTLGW